MEILDGSVWSFPPNCCIQRGREGGQLLKWWTGCITSLHQEYWSSAQDPFTTPSEPAVHATCPIGQVVDKYPWNWTSIRGTYNPYIGSSRTCPIDLRCWAASTPVGHSPSADTCPIPQRRLAVPRGGWPCRWGVRSAVGQALASIRCGNSACPARRSPPGAPGRPGIHSGSSRSRPADRA